MIACTIEGYMRSYVYVYVFFASKQPYAYRYLLRACTMGAQLQPWSALADVFYACIRIQPGQHVYALRPDRSGSMAAASAAMVPNLL